MTTEEEDFWEAYYEEEDRRHKEANRLGVLNIIILVLVLVTCIVYSLTGKPSP